jgi:hypothetical protein
MDASDDGTSGYMKKNAHFTGGIQGFAYRIKKTTCSASG